MQVLVVRPFRYRMAADDYAFDEGEHEMPDTLGEIALGAGWAVPAGKAEKAPANKARKAAPENK